MSEWEDGQAEADRVLARKLVEQIDGMIGGLREQPAAFMMLLAQLYARLELRIEIVKETASPEAVEIFDADLQQQRRACAWAKEQARPKKE